MRWAEHVVRVEDRRDVYRVLVGRPDGKSRLERHASRWEDNIEIQRIDKSKIYIRTGHESPEGEIYL